MRVAYHLGRFWDLVGKAGFSVVLHTNCIGLGIGLSQRSQQHLGEAEHAKGSNPSQHGKGNDSNHNARQLRPIPGGKGWPQSPADTPRDGSQNRCHEDRSPQ